MAFRGNPEGLFAITCVVQLPSIGVIEQGFIIIELRYIYLREYFLSFLKIVDLSTFNLWAALDALP